MAARPISAIAGKLFITATKRKKIIATILAIVVAVSTFSFLYLSQQGQNTANQSLITGNFGPKVTIGMYNYSTDPAVENNTSIVVQVFGLYPQYVAGFHEIGYNLSGLNESNNTHYVQLLNTTITSSSSVIFMSPRFLSVANAWKGFFGEPYAKGTDYPSLILEATKNVYVNGTVQIYTFYNNLLYDPDSIMENSINSGNIQNSNEWFNGSNIGLSMYKSLNYTDLAFSVNLTFTPRPEQVLSNVPEISNGHGNPGIIHPVSASQGSGFYYYWQTSYNSYTKITGTNTSKGYLPLLAVHMGRNTDNGLSLVDLSAAINLQDTTIGINSNQVSWTSSGQVTSTMASSPSYEHVANASSETLTKAYSAKPLNLTSNNYSVRINMTTAYLAIENATYTFIHFSQYTVEYDNEYYVTWHLKPIIIDGKTYYVNVSTTTLVKSVLVNTTSVTHIANGTIGEISAIGTLGGDLQLSAGNAPIMVNQLMQALAEQRPGDNLTMATSGPADSMSASSFWASDSAYTNANQAFKVANAILTTFSVGLAEGLAITDALAATNGGDFDATESVVIAETVGIAAASIGLVKEIVDQFNTIGFVASAKSVSMAYSITNDPFNLPGSSYRFVFYEGSSPVTMSFDGQTCQFYASNSYVNMTGIYNVSSITNNRYLSSPENTSQSSSTGIYQTSGQWSIDSSNNQEEFATYQISSGAQYMAGNVFNQWQNFAFQPGNATNGNDNYYDALGTVYVNLVNYMGQIVASWNHTFDSYNSNNYIGPEWVYVNPTFSIRNGPAEPIVNIQFINDLSGYEPGGSMIHFFNTGYGGLASFAEANANDNTFNNSQPENDEANLAWYGYTTQPEIASWTVPANTLSYMIIWFSPNATAVTYNGETQYGTGGLFAGSNTAASISASLMGWIYDTETVTISEVFELP